jgi:NADPH:quinone reductase-like Zn-dependent oxidoreductase
MPHLTTTGMRALTQDRYGSADAFELRDVPRPVPREGELLVRVEAAGLDRGAWHFMTGEPYLMRLGTGLRAPKVTVPGTNFAGVVEAVGPGVAELQPGDEVYGVSRGTFAEHVVASVAKTARKPAELSFEQAATLPYPTFVALQALHDHGEVQAGQRVLVVGASGAVGTIAVQLAVAAGADVTGVCSARHAELVRSLGAAEVRDYARQELGDGYDLVIDIGGRTSVARLRRALTRTGRLVIIGGEGDRWIGGIQRQLWAMVVNVFVRQKLHVLLVKERAEELRRVNALVAAGQVTPIVAQVFELAGGAAAVRAFEAGTGPGRIVLVP